ncbi:MAG: phospholipase [Flavobacterium sp.]|nr:MAG: phospholipase [Flavobacterium sp.]
MDHSLYHVVREPLERRDKNPLLLLLHGYGSNEEDLFAFAPQLPGEYFIISVRAPYHLPPYGYAWYSINFTGNESNFTDNIQAVRSRDLIAKFIGEAGELYNIDTNDVTLIGFSQGCILSYAVALSYPHLIRRVIAMSGYLNTDLLTENYEENDFSDLKMFVSHGTSDQTIPVAWARKAQPVLDRLNIEYVFKEYPVGHGVAPQNFYDVLAWLK